MTDIQTRTRRQKMVIRTGKKYQIVLGLAQSMIFIFWLALTLISYSRAQGPEENSPQTEQSSKFIQALEEAKSKLQAGLNAWNVELLKEGRDLFLNLFMRQKAENVYLHYYIALADYRLTTFYFASNNKQEAEQYNSEAQKYLEKAMEKDPGFGESFALYSFLLGYEIALHPERAMSLGPKSSEYSAKAFEKDPDNPRINLMQGISLLYTPEAYGGGTDKAIEFLEKSIRLFEKENIKDSLKPSWGKEEAYTFLARAYVQKKEYEKASALLKKALEVNPDFGMAKETLRTLEKEKKEK
jgi:tetratricopeptide (TPR) repeat protein